MKFIPLFFVVALSALVSEGCSNNDNPTANNTYTITTITGANGTVSPAGSTTVAHGSTIRYTMTANSGYHVDSVIVDGVKADSTLTYTFVNVTADHVIRATFAAGAAHASYVGVVFPADAGGQSYMTTGSTKPAGLISIYDPNNSTNNTGSGASIGAPGGRWSGGLCN